ncbi:MAG TPA: type II CAAX endopeptidase family protein [Tepidisphaeraceae bacterium]|jgi:membrane protease YdiL (CAAX protease family)|nr:type II CAAX endopeptidase family protein [Tepidisphaeraceae bacterium]
MTDFPTPYVPPEPFAQPPAPEPSRARERVFGIVISWAVIIAVVAFVSVVVPWLDLRHRMKETRKATTQPVAVSSPGDDLTLRIMGRYAVGWKAMGSSVAGEADIGQIIVPQVLETAKSPTDRIKAATVIAELDGPKRAVELIKESLPKVSPAVRADGEILLRLYRDGAKLSDAERQKLAKDLGWFGELASGYGQPDTDPMRSEAMALAKRTSLALVSALFVVGFALLAGVVMLIVAAVLFFSGRLRGRYERPTSIAGPFVEAFALYIVLFMAGSIVIGLITHGESIAWSLLLTVLLPLAWIWPRVRGVPREEIWRALGWSRGRGVLKEIGCGILGYITGLPVIAIGMLLVMVLVLISKSSPSHPIQNELSTAPMRVLELYIIAAVWAPVFEETMFRGALFSFMRSRFRWLFSASIVALIFAMIHPQGWTTWPALFAIAMVLAGIREWRGSIIGSMTAHALHNGMLVTILIFAVA